MAKVPITTINDNDFKSTEIKELVSAINDRIRPLGYALNNSLTVNDNLSAQFTDVDLQIPPAGSTKSPYPISFDWRFQGLVPQGCLIVKITAQGVRRSQISGANPPDWDFGNGKIIINGIPANLSADTGYTIRFYTFA